MGFVMSKNSNIVEKGFVAKKKTKRKEKKRKEHPYM
jgi:hypothetical protein